MSNCRGLLALNPDRHDTYPKVNSALEQMRHKSDPMEIDEMSGSAEDEYDSECAESHAVGCAKGQGGMGFYGVDDGGAEDTKQTPEFSVFEH